MPLTLPPTATIGQLLRLFCADLGGEPSLMAPFYGPGLKGHGVVTSATDGETACLWTAGKAGKHKDWAALSQFGDATRMTPGCANWNWRNA
ncbi:MAG: hypothetical protein V4675_09990 [Verrucomicrobiota bacterium]